MCISVLITVTETTRRLGRMMNITLIWEIRPGRPRPQAVLRTVFMNDVWRRDYAHGVAMVNVTSQSQTVDLGGEYEKITGKQDPDVNDGSIVNSVTLGAKDGLIMLKTFQTTDNLVFQTATFEILRHERQQIQKRILFI